mgnify:CR=1 FL=1
MRTFLELTQNFLELTRNFREIARKICNTFAFIRETHNFFSYENEFNGFSYKIETLVKFIILTFHKSLKYVLVTFEYL